jgi:hypothetical protein
LISIKFPLESAIITFPCSIGWPAKEMVGGSTISRPLAQAIDQRFPLVLRERCTEMTGAWHRRGDAGPIVLERHLGTEYEGIRKLTVPPTDLGAQLTLEELDGLIEVSNGNGEMEYRSQRIS